MLEQRTSRAEQEADDASANFLPRRTTDPPIFVRRICTSPTTACLGLTFAKTPYGCSS